LDSAFPFIVLLCAVVLVAISGISLAVGLATQRDISQVLQSNRLNALHTARSTHTNSGLLQENDRELMAENKLLKQILTNLEKG
jgi:hypothetical protein